MVVYGIHSMKWDGPLQISSIMIDEKKKTRVLISQCTTSAGYFWDVTCSDFCRYLSHRRYKYTPEYYYGTTYLYR